MKVHTRKKVHLYTYMGTGRVSSFAVVSVASLWFCLSLSLSCSNDHFHCGDFDLQCLLLDSDTHCAEADFWSPHCPMLSSHLRLVFCPRSPEYCHRASMSDPALQSYVSDALICSPCLTLLWLLLCPVSGRPLCPRDIPIIFLLRTADS